MHSYLTFQIDHFLLMEADYNAVAYASLLQKAMNMTYVQLNATLPIELISRYMSYEVYIENYSCISFVATVDLLNF